MKPVFVLWFFLPFSVLLLSGCLVSKTVYQKEPALVVSVVDGDTIKIDGGESVRLIGINSTERGEECYAEAKEKLEGMVGGKIVFLEMDVENRDKYKRLLRYVYLESGEFVNQRMVEIGNAYAYEYPPSVRYAAQFSVAEGIAKFRQEGCLWQSS